MDVQRQDRELGYKQTADKIRQILSKVRETPRSSYKRWVWELIQNAKDVKDPAFGSVSIKISLDENELIFSHNGLPFKVRHLLGIVKQVSTKSSSGKDDEVTGKFGTGFIVTHLLSDTIDIQGYIHDENESYFRLNCLHLDRSGQTSEELMPKIEEANEYILKVETDRTIFPLVEGYAQKKNKNSFDTIFKYNLNSERKKEAAKEGIADLKNTLPVTLVSVEEISEVIIESTIDTRTSQYQVKLIAEEPGLKMLSVQLDNTHTRNFIKFIKNDFCLIGEVVDFDSFSLVERKGDQPVLYRNFPLIGSEKFYFPFILNGFDFNPTEDRNDIVLVNEESNEVISNRSVLESAVEGVIEFTKYLISKNAKNRHLCVLSRIPKLTVLIEEDLKNWLEKLQQNWRTQLIDLELIETESGKYSTLRECRIPNHGSTDEQKDLFHAIAFSLLGEDLVPKRDQNLSWISMTGPKSELESWNLELWYDLEDLLTDLDEIGDLEALKEKVENPIQWLNKLYAFIHEAKETELYDDFGIIPNHLGKFKKLEDLFLEDPVSTIPDPFLDVLESLDENWRDKLIHRDVKLTGRSVESKGLSDVSITINNILNVKVRNSVGVEEYQFKTKDDALNILMEILRLVDSEQANDFRCKVFQRAKDIFDFEENLGVVSNVKDFQFSIAIKLLIMFIHEEIEGCENIDGLAEQLKSDNIKVVLWLNEYLELILNKEDFKTQIEYGNIIPNRDGEFCALEDIYAFGTEETPLDDELIEILRELDEKQKWRKELIYDGISIKLEPRKFEELGLTIDNTLKELEKEETLNPGSLNFYKQTIYKLLDWCKNHEKLTENYLRHTSARSNDLWVKFSMTPEIMALLRDEGSIELLRELAKANLSSDDKQKVIDIATNFGKLSEKGKRKIVERAEEILEDERELFFKKKVGEDVEQILNNVFEREFPNYEARLEQKRDYDILIRNKLNPSNQYFIELKSIRENNTEPIKMGIHQARKAKANPDNYALLLIKRPPESNIKEAYLRNNIICDYQIGKDVISEVDKSKMVDEIVSSKNSIKLEIKDPTMKVHIRQEYIVRLGKDFEELKRKIHEAIK